jgi:hypothetical protein
VADLSRRLEVVFGARLGQLDRTHIEALVTNGVTEDFDLDFKSELYGNNDAARRDLAGDVAALANTAGGVIVVGVAEDDQARAVATRAVALSDGEVRRIRLIIASNVAPIPGFDVIPIPGDDPSTGFYLLAVPRSPSAPHGVLVNDGFRYPVRNGSTIRYLSEPEVATAYRERFLSADRQIQRAGALIADGRARLARGASWLVMCLVPEQPGFMDITQAGFTAFQQWALTTPKLRLNDEFHRFKVGAHRYIADGGEGGSDAEFVLLEAHTDGAGVFALQVTDEAGSLDETGRVSTLDDQNLAAGIMVGLRQLATHAQENAHAGGPAMLRAELVPAKAATVLVLQAAGSGAYPRSQPTAASELESIEMSTTIEDLASSGRTVSVAAAALLHQVGQQFGIPEVAMIRRDGAVNTLHWNPTFLQHLRQWAADAEVDLGS